MWTRATDYEEKNEGQLWSPNHFVPCVLKDLPNKGSTSTCNMAHPIKLNDPNLSLGICLPAIKDHIFESIHTPKAKVGICEASNTVHQYKGATCSVPISSAHSKKITSDLIQIIALAQLSYKVLPLATEKNQIKLTSFISNSPSDDMWG